jgi:hypothetical protein
LDLGCAPISPDAITMNDTVKTNVAALRPIIISSQHMVVLGAKPSRAGMTARWPRSLFQSARCEV